MTTTAPHYLLISECARVAARSATCAGRWRFVLEELGGASRLEASDDEPGVTGERLELLTVIRGLEALDQPSRVTLITASRYVSRGFRYGLVEWRNSDWKWERFGQMVPIKNNDLWQRVDRALEFHRVECRIWSFAPEAAAEPGVEVESQGWWNRVKGWWNRAFGSPRMPAAEPALSGRI